MQIFTYIFLGINFYLQIFSLCILIVKKFTIPIFIYKFSVAAFLLPKNLQYQFLLLIFVMFKKQSTLDSRNSGSRFSGPPDLMVSVFGPRELEILIFTLDLAILSK
jgi:hypothetical protein